MFPQGLSGVLRDVDANLFDYGPFLRFAERAQRHLEIFSDVFPGDDEVVNWIPIHP